MPARLRMEGDVRGTGVSEVLDQVIHGTHHQMHVYWRRNPVGTQVLAYLGAKSQDRDIVVVHDIEMNDIRTGIQYIRDFLA